MRRSAALAAVACVLGAWLAGGCSGGASEGPPRHLLLVTIDTLRADHLQTYGYDRPTSPRIDELAREGVVFERAYSVASWTLPSVVSLMTSLVPSAHGCQGDRSSLGEAYSTLAEHLAALGFRTAAVTSHVYLASKRGLAQGFEHYDEELVLDDRRRSHEAISSPAITEKAIAWLDERAREPERWFLWLHYFDPHSLYLDHPGVVESFGPSPQDRYDAEIAFTDLHVGKVLDHLETLDLAVDTLVVLVADHGEEFLDHGGFGHRANLYDATLRVPLIVRAPGVEPRRVREPVGSIDVFPTACELLDVSAPAGTHGRSLVPWMRGVPADRPPLLAEMRNSNKKDWDALVEGRYKLLHDVTGGRKLLFDLEADPGEKNDLAAEHPEVVDAMWERMQTMIAAAREHADRVGRGELIELTEDETNALEQLGYGGDH